MPVAGVRDCADAPAGAPRGIAHESGESPPGCGRFADAGRKRHDGRVSVDGWSVGCSAMPGASGATGLTLYLGCPLCVSGGTLPAVQRAGKAGAPLRLHRNLNSSRLMTPLYPPIEPYWTGHLRRDGGHAIYLEECGRPDGVPVIYLHGGPGSGCGPPHRRFFDPSRYRILLLDQRGAGRSTPLGECRANSTQDLVADLEAVRHSRGIDRWALFGGSWGATLALVYALTHPRAVSALLLRGVFLARDADLAWFFGAQGAARLFPEQWQSFRAAVQGGDWAALIDAYHERVHGSDPDAALAAADAWSRWGDLLVNWPRPDPASAAGAFDCDRRCLAKVRIETHYACNRYFLAGGRILSDARLLPDVPIVILQGQGDLVCPAEGACSLHRAVPGSRLRMLPDAGHLVWAPSMLEALVEETDRLCDLLGR